jgi:glutathione S-transferase
VSTAKLYVVPGSHPSVACALMLERKRIEYRRVDLLPVIHKPLLRLLGFPGTTVPALKLDGRRLQDSTVISRALDGLRPEPPLFPADPALRAAVEDAERWGESALQPVPRRLSWWAFSRDRGGMRSFAEDSRLGVPLGLAMRTAAPIITIERRINAAGEGAARADVAALPALLDQVDALVAAGTIGGPEPNAADYQIATSVRLLMCFDDLREEIGQRPAGSHAVGIVPRFPGRIGPVIPQEWLQRR